MAKKAAQTPTADAPPKPDAIAAMDASKPSLKALPELTAAGDVRSIMKQIEAGGTAAYMVPIDALKVMPGLNIRIREAPSYVEKIQDLKRSIQTEGFYNTKPLAGFVANVEGEAVIYVTDGHRRLEAALLARAEGVEIDRLPVVIKRTGTDMTDLTVALIKENSGEQPTPLEVAIAVKRLMSMGLTKELVAKRFGFTERWVDRLLSLVGAPKAIRQAVMEEKISPTAAIEIIVKHKDKAEEVVKAAVAQASKRDGKVKVKAKDLKPATGVKMSKVRTPYSWEAGQSVALADVKSLLPLFPDSDWYTMTGDDGMIELTEPIRVTVTIERAAKPVDEENLPPPKPRGRPRKDRSLNEAVTSGNSVTENDSAAGL